MENIEMTLKHAAETYLKMREMREDLEDTIHCIGSLPTMKMREYSRAINALENAEKSMAPFLADYIVYQGRC